jgi:hypothetical protein
LVQGATSAVFTAESGPIDGDTTNIATVTCKDQLDNDVTDTDTVTVTSIDPSLLVEKVCTPDLQPAPGTIDWLVTVTNTSNDATLFDVFVEDIELGISLLIGTLAPAESVTIPVQEFNLAAGTYINTASASGVDQLENQYTSEKTATCVVEEVGENGCTPGYWKSNATFKKDPANAWTVENPDDTLATATFIPQQHDSSLTLLETLKLKGGNDAEGMEGNLLRHCVAAKLNAENNNVAFGIPNAADVIAACNEAMATEDRDTMEDLKDILDDFNNAGCSINMKGQSVDPE